MDDKVKILLGRKQFQGGVNQDVFLSVELNRTFNELPKETYYNDFDLNKQFKKERNSCRNFYIYGIADSPYINCDNIIIHFYKSSGLTEHIGNTTTIPLTSANWTNKNFLGLKRGQYKFLLEDYTDSQKIFIRYNTQSYEKQLVYTADTYNYTGGTVSTTVDYGTNDEVVLLNGESMTVENDFPFFYNKHWIKFNLEI